jgi:Reverse transcriptase (RNA-dependent DNA polymerase)
MSIRTTARFELERRRQLRVLFDAARLAKLWRSRVKDQMRSFEITDLHDYYDFNYAIESRADAIVDKVLAGQYRAETPLIYRTEKKLGVCRHMLIPAPSDTLVFQLLTDALYASIIQAQPSKRAYYARARHSLSLPHQHNQANSYPWFILWPKFQRDIWNFSKAHKFLVTTDIANYFDSIGLRELRHVISAIVKTKEVYLDLVFSLIEDLSWNPDYLPTSHRGLPIIEIEAPRLLAHAFLFEVDRVLKNRTKDNFVRWMDDINFGVPDRRTASVVLGEISDVLKSRGLALNLGKTEVMTAANAEHHFMFRENLMLDKTQAAARRAKRFPSRKRLATKLGSKLKKHIQFCNARNGDKVTKRFLTILGSLGVPVILSQAKALYVARPQLRRSVLSYLCQLPFSARVAKTFRELLDETEQYDDATRFSLISAIVDWTVPRDRRGFDFVTSIRKRLQSMEGPFEWYCRLRFLAKYGKPSDVLKVGELGKRFREPFFARQLMAALPRALGVAPKQVRTQWRTEISTGFSDSASVANNLLNFSKRGFPNTNDRLYYYLFPSKVQKPYPLAKFLLLCCVASSERRAGVTLKRPEVATHVTDPWYRHWLEKIQPSWY